MRLSARNRLTGTVTEVRRGEAAATVVLDCGGQRIVSTITRESADELGLDAGTKVTAIVKASDVMIAVED